MSSFGRDFRKLEYLEAKLLSKMLIIKKNRFLNLIWLQEIGPQLMPRTVPLREEETTRPIGAHTHAGEVNTCRADLCYCLIHPLSAGCWSKRGGRTDRSKQAHVSSEWENSGVQIVRLAVNCAVIRVTNRDRGWHSRSAGCRECNDESGPDTSVTSDVKAVAGPFKEPWADKLFFTSRALMMTFFSFASRPHHSLWLIGWVSFFMADIWLIAQRTLPLLCSARWRSSRGRYDGWCAKGCRALDHLARSSAVWREPRAEDGILRTTRTTLLSIFYIVVYQAKLYRKSKSWWFHLKGEISKDPLYIHT